MVENLRQAAGGIYPFLAPYCLLRQWSRIMKHELATLALWAIAITVTYLKLDQAGAATILGPVYAVCMIGCIIIVRAARATAGRGTA
jgi:L-lactate permease